MMGAFFVKFKGTVIQKKPRKNHNWFHEVCIRRRKKTFWREMVRKKDNLFPCKIHSRRSAEIKKKERVKSRIIKKKLNVPAFFQALFTFADAAGYASSFFFVLIFYFTRAPFFFCVYRSVQRPSKIFFLCLSLW